MAVCRHSQTALLSTLERLGDLLQARTGITFHQWGQGERLTPIFAEVVRCLSLGKNIFFVKNKICAFAQVYPSPPLWSALPWSYSYIMSRFLLRMSLDLRKNTHGDLRLAQLSMYIPENVCEFLKVVNLHSQISINLTVGLKTVFVN